MGERRVFTLSQVAQHNSSKDCWLVIHGRVMEVTKLLEEHPGGEEVIVEVAGKDATKEFDVIGHSKAAQEMMVKYQVGVVQGAIVEFEELEVKKKDVVDKEMSAFVIKQPKSLFFYHSFLPFLLAALYFGYRCLTY
ncbi:hypothetical protein VNO78_00575 [Psophocarpus tetragonolobus]|uniref:Cytochrome b5 heme-binding domain-containing protein n=1 Tax=Psophocarpus tetragonolobus TaxID=3891 RepID=A0AAN9SY81_PSOTE